MNYTREQYENDNAAEAAEQTAVKCRATIAERMHVAKMGDGFHIIEIPAADGSPFTAWPGPFTTMLAAELFRAELIGAYEEGDANKACCSEGLFVVFEQQARVLEFLEKREDVANLHVLARDLVRSQPWQNGPHGPHGPPGEGDLEIPF